MSTADVSAQSRPNNRYMDSSLQSRVSIGAEYLRTAGDGLESYIRPLV